MYIIQQIVEEPKNAKLLQNVDWYIMPVVNPDGIWINYLIAYAHSLRNFPILLKATSTRT